jgi:hypothetical protein
MKENGYWKCPKTGNLYYMKEGDNFIKKFVGFCFTCNCSIDQIGFIQEFNFCFWKEVFCKTCEPERYRQLFKEN